MANLIKRIMAIPECNIDIGHYNKFGLSDLVLYDKNLGTVRGVFNPNHKLTQYYMVTNEIHA